MATAALMNSPSIDAVHRAIATEIQQSPAAQASSRNKEEPAFLLGWTACTLAEAIGHINTLTTTGGSRESRKAAKAFAKRFNEA